MKASSKVTRLRDALTLFLSKIPMVERPKRHVPLKTKLVFTIAMFFLMVYLVSARLDPIYSPWDWFPRLMIMPHAGWQVAIIRIAATMSMLVVS